MPGEKRCDNEQIPVLSGKSLRGVGYAMSYGCVRVWDENDVEYRIKTDELLRILGEHNYRQVRKRDYVHLTVITEQGVEEHE